jgi:outer membrane protein insertion porin family
MIPMGGPLAAALVVCMAGCGGPTGSGRTTPTPPKPATTAVAPPSPAIVDTATGLSGPITTIRVETSNQAQRTEVQAVLGGLTGKPIERDQLRAALTRVMQLPGVADVAARGVQRADGIELVVELTGYPVMRSLTAIEHGGAPISLGMAAVPTNSPLDPQRLTTLAASLRDRYLSSGHLDAEATWRQTVVANGVAVVIEVTPGVASTIASVAFTGNTISSKLLLGLTSPLLVTGQPVLVEQLERAGRALEEHYWNAGYATIQVQVPAPITGKNALVFKLTEGPKFKIGAIAITGLPAVEVANQLTLFAVKQGDVFSRNAIVAGRDRILAALAASGYPNATVDPITQLDLERKTIGLTLEINRGTPAPM